MATIDLATVLSQTPFVQNVAGAQQSIPAAQQVLTEQAFQHNMELQKSQVQKVEKSEEVEETSKDKEKEKGRHYSAAGKRGAEHETSQSAVETTASNASPWSGNIIDVKI
ncbi:MAG: hypothetical protein HQK81_01630 [Desulfovibrionaceae bacterium]|nr:hypothetical protein [Desulfovibrionaceae bacterium]MBF0512750.1 hypothetical protein [Desulfovibrionaceae bacterium]